VKEARQQGARVRFQRFRDIDEFDNIQPPLAAFIFSDEGLRAVEPCGNISLRELTGFPEFGQQFLQSLLPWRAERFWHINRLIILRPVVSVIPFSDNPILGYYGVAET
jgi:hypothetical protein